MLGFPGANCGIFTSVTGTAPNRKFNIEWRAVHFADTTTSANFEVVLHESLTSFDVIYGATSDSGLDETSGVQASPLVRLRPSRAARLRSPMA